MLCLGSVTFAVESLILRTAEYARDAIDRHAEAMFTWLEE